MNLHLDGCSHRAAKYAVEHWHYSKSLPAVKLFKLGVWENEQFIGVIIFSTGANPNLHKPYNVGKFECCELSRIALKEHNACISKIVKIAILILKKQSPKIRLIVSFADQNQGHLGIIYQAGNWIYTGTTGCDYHYFYKGRWVHRRQLHSLGISSKDYRGRKKKTLGRHRYLYPLKKPMRKQIESLRQPYPKRAGSDGATQLTKLGRRFDPDLGALQATQA